MRQHGGFSVKINFRVFQCNEIMGFMKKIANTALKMTKTSIEILVVDSSLVKTGN